MSNGSLVRLVCGIVLGLAAMVFIVGGLVGRPQSVLLVLSGVGLGVVGLVLLRAGLVRDAREE